MTKTQILAFAKNAAERAARADEKAEAAKEIMQKWQEAGEAWREMVCVWAMLAAQKDQIKEASNGGE